MVYKTYLIYLCLLGKVHDGNLRSANYRRSFLLIRVRHRDLADPNNKQIRHRKPARHGKRPGNNGKIFNRVLNIIEKLMEILKPYLPHKFIRYLRDERF